jgi:hypothetical protein
MKAYEVWQEDPERYISSWNTLTEASQEVERLNNKFNRAFFIKQNSDERL